MPPAPAELTENRYVSSSFSAYSDINFFEERDAIFVAEPFVIYVFDDAKTLGNINQHRVDRIAAMRASAWPRDRPSRFTQVCPAFIKSAESNAGCADV